MIDSPDTQPAWVLTTQCPKCQLGKLYQKRSVTNGGIFLGCSRWPTCNATAAYDETFQSVAADNAELKTIVDELSAKLQRLGARVPGKGLLRRGLTSHLKVVK